MTAVEFKILFVPFIFQNVLKHVFRFVCVLGYLNNYHHMDVNLTLNPISKTTSREVA